MRSAELILKYVDEGVNIRVTVVSRGAGPLALLTGPAETVMRGGAPQKLTKRRESLSPGILIEHARHTKDGAFWPRKTKFYALTFFFAFQSVEVVLL